MPKGVSKKVTDNRANNKGVIKPPGERKKPIVFSVKEKNADAIKEKFKPLIAKEDERLSKKSK